MPRLDHGKEDKHYHCEDCEHCGAMHAINGDMVKCMYCMHILKECHADAEERQKILFYTFVEMNRAFIQEVGI